MCVKSVGTMPTWNSAVPSESPSPSLPSALLKSLANTHAVYESLMDFAVPFQYPKVGQDPNLGGRLHYVGELDERGRTFAIAGNVAGVATLAASGDPAVLRRSQQEGAVDFVVNSLDEALRILKNEIRKRQPVAVAVSKSPAEIEKEMLERGVLPDLIPMRLDWSSPAIEKFLAQGTRQVAAVSHDAERRLRIWTAPAEYAQNLAAFEALLAEQLASDDYLNRRWLRLSPRYLGADARRLRSMACDESTVEIVAAKVGKPVFPPKV
jgi:urocanate hydratase